MRKSSDYWNAEYMRESFFLICLQRAAECPGRQKNNLQNIGEER